MAKFIMKDNGPFVLLFEGKLRVFHAGDVVDADKSPHANFSLVQEAVKVPKLPKPTKFAKTEPLTSKFKKE